MKNYHSHFGVYGLVLNKAQDEILLIKKMRGPYTGMFDLPGGSPEIDETLEQTLVREILEETACEVIHYQQLGAVSSIFEYQEDSQQKVLRHLGVLYQADVIGTPRIDGDGEDAGGCTWFKISDLANKNTTPFVQMALDLFNK